MVTVPFTHHRSIESRNGDPYGRGLKKTKTRKINKLSGALGGLKFTFVAPICAQGFIPTTSFDRQLASA